MIRERHLARVRDLVRWLADFARRLDRPASPVKTHRASPAPPASQNRDGLRQRRRRHRPPAPAPAPRGNRRWSRWEGARRSARRRSERDARKRARMPFCFGCALGSEVSRSSKGWQKDLSGVRARAASAGPLAQATDAGPIRIASCGKRLAVHQAIHLDRDAALKLGLPPRLRQRTQELLQDCGPHPTGPSLEIRRALRSVTTAAGIVNTGLDFSHGGQASGALQARPGRRGPQQPREPA